MHQTTPKADAFENEKNMALNNDFAEFKVEQYDDYLMRNRSG